MSAARRGRADLGGPGPEARITTQPGNMQETRARSGAGLGMFGVLVAPNAMPPAMRYARDAVAPNAAAQRRRRRGHLGDFLTFESLGLSADLVRMAAEEGYEQPTPVQSAAIPLVLAG